MRRFGVTEAHLREGRVTEPVRQLLAHACARAREYYRAANRLLTPQDARSLVAAEIMGGIYRAILDRVERSGYDVFGETIRVPRPRRAAGPRSVGRKAESA